MTSRRRIENRLADLESEARYDDVSPETLYMRMLKDSEPHAPDYPGAGEAFIRRLKLHQLREKLKEQRRAGVHDRNDGESESAEDDP